MEWLAAHGDQLGVVGLAVFGCVGFVVALAKGWIFTAPQYRELAHDRNEWRAESRIKDVVIERLGEEAAERNEQLRHAREGAELAKAVVAAVGKAATTEESAS